VHKYQAAKKRESESETGGAPRRAAWQAGRLMVAILPVVSACANVPQQSGAPFLDKQEIVAKLAQSRWDALRNKDFDAAYKLMSPASRPMITLEDFRSRSSKVTWKAASVGKVECSANDLCTVQVDAKYSYRLRLGKEVENDHVVTETWRNTAGGWWYVPAAAL